MKVELAPKGNVKSVQVKGMQIALPWSIECGDAQSFFSLDLGGWRNQTKVLGPGKLEVTMSQGKFVLEFSDKVEGNKIWRKAKLTALKQTTLMDFVIQYRFIDTAFQTATIAGQEYVHRNKNIYYQYPTQAVTLRNADFTVAVKMKSFAGADKFKQVMYLRDKKSEWVVHARLLPKIADIKIIKLNTKFLRLALPQFISNLLLKSKAIEKYLLYKTELRPYSRLNILGKLLKPTAYPLTVLQPGEQLDLVTEMEILGD